MSIYHRAAKRYIPNEIKILFIAESPPHYNEGEKPRYFYFDELNGKDYLFRNIMKVLLPKELKTALETRNKIPALLAFCHMGYFLIDAVNHSINKLPLNERVGEISRELPSLLDRVERLIRKKTPIILIKKTTLGIVQRKLLSLGYFLCYPEPLPFPAFGKQTDFQESLLEALSNCYP